VSFHNDIGEMQEDIGVDHHVNTRSVHNLTDLRVQFFCSNTNSEREFASVERQAPFVVDVDQSVNAGSRSTEKPGNTASMNVAMTSSLLTKMRFN
jgi:hypothetical protein